MFKKHSDYTVSHKKSCRRTKLIAFISVFMIFALSISFLFSGKAYADDTAICMAVCTANNSINLRKGPGTNYSKVDTLPANVKVPVYSNSGSWCKISYKGKVCYASANYLRMENFENGAAGYVTATGSVNIREGVGTDAKKLGVLSKYDSLQAFELKDGWYRVSYSGKTGWISGKYLGFYPINGSEIPVTPPSDTPSVSPSEPTVTPTPAVTDKTVIGTAVCTAKTSMNLRSGPGTSYSKVGNLPAKTLVNVYTVKGSWCEISYNGNICWASASYLNVTLYSDKPTGTPVEPVQPIEPQKKVIGTAVCTANTSMNLRSGPGTNYSKIGTLPAKTVVDVYTVQGSWCEIKYNGNICWASSSYLNVTLYTDKPTEPVEPVQPVEPVEPVEPVQPVEPQKTVIGTAVCTANTSMNLRNGPGTNYTKIGTLPGKAVVNVYTVIGNWCEINYNGNIYWASADYLNVTLYNNKTDSTVTLNRSSSIIGIGDYLKMYAKSETEGILNWSSSNDSVATVDSNGVIYAVSEGIAVITATAESGASASVNVKVESGLPLPNKDITIDENVYDLYTQITEPESDIKAYISTLDEFDAKERIVLQALRFAGVPYKTADCSQISLYVYGTDGIDFERTAANQAKQFSVYEIDYSKIEPGDLVFFKNYPEEECSCGITCKRYRGIHHVAIYMGMINGTGYFVEASSVVGKTVIRSWDGTTGHSEMLIEMAVSIPMAVAVPV